MGTHIKTTIEISDSLLKEAKRVASRERVTLRSLVEKGLRHELAQRGRRASFRMRRASFKGKGLQPESRDLSWDQLRDLTYSGRGT
jgi:hypothetical protein